MMNFFYEIIFNFRYTFFTCQDKIALSQYPNIHSHILEKLSEDEDGDVRYAVASNPNTPVHVLEKLSGDREMWVRNSVAINPNTPVRILEKLSSDEDWMVRKNVAKHPNTPVQTLEKLSGDKDWVVRRRAKEELEKRVGMPTGIPFVFNGSPFTSVQDTLEYTDTNAVESYLDPLVFEIYADLLKLSREDV